MTECSNTCSKSRTDSLSVLPCKVAKQPWPKADRMDELFQAIAGVLEQSAMLLSAEEVASHFKNARRADVAALFGDAVV